MDLRRGKDSLLGLNINDTLGSVLLGLSQCVYLDKQK